MQWTQTGFRGGNHKNDILNLCAPLSDADGRCDVQHGATAARCGEAVKHGFSKGNDVSTASNLPMKFIKCDRIA